MGRVSEEKSRSEKIRDGESQKREDAGARKGRKVAIHCVFTNWGSGESKSNRFGGGHTVVALSTFPSQKCQNTQFSDHF